MINLEQTLHRAIALTKCRDAVLAAPFDLPSDLCRNLVSMGLISGFVANRSAQCGAGESVIAGWWLDRNHGKWHISRTNSRQMLYLGPAAQISGRMLIAARRSGIRSVHFYDTLQDQSIRFAITRLLATRVRIAVAGRIAGSARGVAYTNRSFEYAFRDLYADIGDHFRRNDGAFERHRALLVLGSLGPGGAERQASLTAIGIANRSDWQPVIGCSHIDGEGANFHRAEVEHAGIPVTGVPITPPEMDHPVVQRALARSQHYSHIGFQHVAHVVLSYACFIAKLRPSLVQTWMDYSNVLAGIAADIVGVPRIVMSGRSVAPDNFEIFQPYMRAGYLELLSRRSDVVFTNNSRAGALDYARWLDIPPDRLTVVRNGFNFPETRPDWQAAQLKASLGIPSDARVVGSIFRFSEEKQPNLWVDAAANVIARDPSTYFVAFGDGVMFESTRDRVAELQLADRIKLPGVTKDPWIALTMMDVFLLTSRMEGLPNVLIEAQAMGVPVVTTGQGGMSETYRDGITGLTAAQTVSAIADQVSRLLCDRDLARTMGVEAARFARREFAIDSMIDSTLAAFHTDPAAVRKTNGHD
jgi:glycosyltransferase involved in cell wall biosynthesis